MDLISGTLIPALIILITNIFSDTYGSDRYEVITALFGWAACISLLLYFPISLYLDFFSSVWLQHIEASVIKVFLFSLITALSRDYEKILKPLVDSFRKRK